MAMSRTCSSSCKFSFFSPTWNLMRGSISSRLCPAVREMARCCGRNWGDTYPNHRTPPPPLPLMGPASHPSLPVALSDVPDRGP